MFFAPTPISTPGAFVAWPQYTSQGLPTAALAALSTPPTAVYNLLTACLQVALVRLCYGDSSLEMVQAMADLAEGYAREGLWPQVREEARTCVLRALDEPDGPPGRCWSSSRNLR